MYLLYLYMYINVCVYVCMCTHTYERDFHNLLFTSNVRIYLSAGIFCIPAIYIFYSTFFASLISIK